LGCIAVVGITDRGAASLSPEAAALVDSAQVLCGGKRHLAFFPDHPAEQLVFERDVLSLVERLRGESRPTVVLASGDPGCFGISPLLSERLGPERVTVIPNVGSVQTAFARLGVAWHDAAILSAHGRPLDGILPAALLARKAAILTDGVNTPAAIARALIETGDHDAKVDVFEHLDGADERHYSGRLRDVVEREFAPLNVMIIRHEGDPRAWPLGLPEAAFAHRAGLITKAEVRAVSLSKLRLHERATLWDVGAGCGSVSIEAGALLRQGMVYAVERDEQQMGFLEANRRSFGAGNVKLVRGAAPEALSSLPQPDRVFVGGSGDGLIPTLEVAADRLSAGGRIVANLVSLEHLARMEDWAKGGDLPIEVVQIAVSRSVPTAGLTRLESLNPVFVVTIDPNARP